MPELGRMHYDYYVGPGEGLRLELEVIAFEEHYRAQVLLNGVCVRHAHRKRLKAALKWASGAAAVILETMGVSLPEQLDLDRFSGDVEPGFVA